MQDRSEAMAQPTAPPLRIAIADDHALFREGMRAVLRQERDIEVVAEIERADDIAPTLAHVPCAILLLDLHMDRYTLDDIETLSRLASIVVVTASQETYEAAAAVRAGARAVVYKRYTADTLLRAIRAVARGGVWMPRGLHAYVVKPGRPDPVGPLTARECDVIQLVSQGLRNSEVAERLRISERTVKTYMNAIFRKVGVRDRVELALYAAHAGIIGIGSRRPAGAEPAES
ncbi:MAG: response regulator transcription factor [Candidatus Binatia bacterium]